MIQPNELRIGNLVYAEVGLPSLDIHQIKPKDIFDISLGLARIYPIPLTEEWLIKAGFVKNDLSYETDRITYFAPDDVSMQLTLINESTFIQFTLDDSVEGSFNLFESAPIADIKYLHQLQNIYFALTGDELNIEI